MQYKYAGWLYISRELYKKENLFSSQKLCSSCGHHTFFVFQHHAQGLSKNISQVNFVVDSVEELFECMIFQCKLCAVAPSRVNLEILNIRECMQLRVILLKF